MQETMKITADIDVKLNKSTSLCHSIWIFINMRQVKTDPKETFKLRFDNIYETMELTGMENTILR